MNMSLHSDDYELCKTCKINQQRVGCISKIQGMLCSCEICVYGVMCDTCIQKERMFDFVSGRIQEYLDSVTPKHLVYIKTSYRGNKLRLGILGGPKIPCKRCFELKDSIPYKRIYGGRWCYKCIIDFLLRDVIVCLKTWHNSSFQSMASPQREITYSSYLQFPPEEVMDDIYDIILSTFTSPSYEDICKVVNSAICTFETAEAYLFRCGNDVQKAIKHLILK